MTSSATALPITRGRRNRPPAPATSERFTSGRPKLVSSAQMIMSQERATSVPPASADPVIAAISGLVRSRRAMPAKPPFLVDNAPPLPAEISLRSAPAQKALPTAVRMPTQTSGSDSIWSRAASIVAAISPLMALRASGRFMVMTATWPFLTYSTGMGRSSFGGFLGRAKSPSATSRKRPSCRTLGQALLMVP